MLACAPIEDALDDAKAAHAGEGSEGSRTVKRQAMATLHETRAWLRAADVLATLPQSIAGLKAQLASAGMAADGQERVARLERKLAAARARLARIEERFGPLVAEMEALAAGGGR